MDISAYWKEIKDQAKMLSGVGKIDSGMFHKSGVSSSLKDYIKAVQGGDPKKIMKAAKAAFKSTDSYNKTVHKKAVKTGRKAMNDKQLRSAKIVGDALDKILVQLQNVLTGDALAGSFDGDGKDDAAHSNEPLDPKLDRDAKAHVILRLKVAKDAKGYAAKYKSDAAPVANYVKLAQKAAGDAKSTKAAGDTFNNMQAQDIAARAVDEIQGILDGVAKHYDTNISGVRSDFMKARLDFGGRGDLPSWYRPDYMKGHNAAWAKVMVQVAEIDKIRGALTNAISQAQRFADVAESFSMQAIDPKKLIAKLTKIESDAEKIFNSVDLAHKRVLNVEEMVGSIMSSQLDGPAKAKAIVLREGDAKKRIGQCVAGTKQIQEMVGRIKAIAGGAEDASVRDAAAAAAVPIRKTVALMKDFKTEVADALKAISEAKLTLRDMVG